ncbi:hypothetical protein GSI_04894 [Ganoderma sinense ZZ0214-1]|uniref:Uncharacterized protein n=1 Tax=Ganoderma sinense ZZ0214-1 TaxID=1077348 RepID=A0A2G8SGF6_9APHY|nr:hypothetical protein GSI_04894 [Ganoderma sinense ZZ0214-1]
MFISPKLRSLSLFVRYDESESESGGWLLQEDREIVKTLFRQIVSTAPRIKTLSIESNVLELPPTCLSRIRDLEGLTALHAHNCVLDYALLRWLGGCPSLRTLSGTIDMAKVPPRPTDPTDEDYFDYRNEAHAYQGRSPLLSFPRVT